MNDKHLVLDYLKQSHLPAFDWQCEQHIFIPLRGSWFAQSEADFDLEEEIDKFFTSDKKVLLLLGDSGAGKSLYTQSLAIKLWKTHTESKPIPLWTSLPSLKDPINHAIEETLTSYGFAAEQIEHLRKTQRFVFILDAYDEIRQFKNLYVSNQLDQWQCKMIVTCRREYLYRQDNYKLYFQPFHGEKAQHGAYDEIIIRPLNPAQIQSYIKQYVSNQETVWKETELYEQSIGEIPGLKNLVTSPFMLKLTMEVLPEIVGRFQSQIMIERKCLTQAALYDAFIEQWFNRQEQKLQAAGHIGQDEDIKPEFWSFAKDLAQAMHSSNVTQIFYEEDTDIYGEATEPNPWKRFFNPDNKRLALLQTACLVRELTKNHYAFIHASLSEYFLTRNLYENILENSSSQPSGPVSAAITAAAIDSTIASQNIEPAENPFSKWKQDYFNRRLLVEEQGTLQFLADRVEEQEDFKQSLFDRVYASRDNPEMEIAAANAITILNRAKISFSGMDLSGIQVPQADLSYALMHHTNLSRSNLRNVNLIQSYLDNANFSQSDLEEIDLGELPFFSLENAITSLCYSNDGSYLAIGTGEMPRYVPYGTEEEKNYSILVWDLKRGYEYCRFNGNSGQIKSLAFSPNGKYLVSVGSGIVQLWSVEARTIRGELSTVDATCVAFSPDGSLIATGNENYTVRLWLVNTLEQVGDTLKGHTNSVSCVAFSPDGKYLASASSRFNDGGPLHNDCAIRLWTVDTQMPRGEPLVGHTDGVNSIAFSPEGNLLASVSIEGDVRIWSVDTQKMLGFPLLCTEGKYNFSRDLCTVAFSPDGGLIAAGGKNRIVSLWSVKTQTQVGAPLVGHTNTIMSIAFNPDGMSLASAGYDKTVRFWLVKDRSPLFNTRVGHTAPVNSVAISPDCKLLASAGDDGDIKLWSVDKQVQISSTLVGHMETVNSVVFSADGMSLASAGDSYNENDVQIWSFKEQFPTCQQLKHASSCVAISPDSKLLAMAGHNGKVELWSIESQTLSSNPHMKNDCGISSIAFSPDGKFLATGGGSYNGGDSELVYLQLWSMDTKTRWGDQFIGHTDTVLSVAFTSNGKYLASGSFDKSIRLWSVETQRAFGKPLIGHTDGIKSVACSPDGKYLASASFDNTVRLWDLSTQICQNIIYRGINLIRCVAFSYDGAYLAFTCGDEIGLLHRAISPNFSCYYYLTWYSGTAFLTTYGLMFNDAKGLSKNNRLMLTQLAEGEIDQAVGKINNDCSSQNKLANTEMISQEAKSDNNQSVIYNASFWRFRAYERLLLKQYKDTINDYDKAILLDPEESTSYANRAYALASLGRWEESVSDLDKAIDKTLNPIAYFYLLRGRAKFALKQYIEANLDFDEAVKLNAANTEFEESIVFTDRANSLNLLGRWEEAISDYNELIRRDCNNAELYINRSEIKAKLSRLSEAVDDISKAIKLSSKSAEYYDSRAFYLSEMGRFEEAILDYTVAIELKPKDEDYLNFRGIIKCELQRYKEGIEDFEKSLQIRPENSQALNEKGFAYLFLGNIAEAQRHFNMLLSKIITVNDIDGQRMQQYAKVGMSFIAWLNNTVDRLITNLFREMYGSIEMLYRRIYLSCGLLVKFYLHTVSNPLFNQNKMKLKGAYDEVLELILTVSNENQTMPKPLFYLAQLLCLSGQTAKAKESLGRCLQISPQFETARQLLETCDERKPIFESSATLVAEIGLDSQSLNAAVVATPAFMSKPATIKISNNTKTALNAEVTTEMALPKGTAEISAKKGLFARIRDSVSARNKDKQDIDKNEKIAVLSSK